MRCSRKRLSNLSSNRTTIPSIRSSSSYTVSSGRVGSAGVVRLGKYELTLIVVFDIQLCFCLTNPEEARLNNWKMASKGKTTRGTIKDYPNFDANHDAEVLRKAMKGLGTDESAILHVLTTRSSTQRMKINLQYKTLFGRDLVEDLKSELGGKFEKLIVGLMKTPLQYDVFQLHNALKGAGTDEKCLIEILASRTNQELRAIIKAYKEEYGKDLEESIVSDTSGHFQRILVILLQANRDESTVYDDASVKKDAQELFQAGELKCGTDESTFLTIIGTKSFAHLRQVFSEYMKISGYQIEESVSSETSGNLRTALLAVVKCIRSVPEYFATTLHNAMRGAGTDDDTLIRVMISRSEVDLLDIREKFYANYGKTLSSMIKNDTSGDYRNALLSMCGGEDK
ncbi:annexin A5-like [Chiloscyllium punctatum]|uniref:annexin A5-like n=1 Tax=Chiloscyllium punctatum TaxID=137246 RepID=UPI003B63BD2C